MVGAEPPGSEWELVLAQPLISSKKAARAAVTGTRKRFIKSSGNLGGGAGMLGDY